MDIRIDRAARQQPAGRIKPQRFFDNLTRVAELRGHLSMVDGSACCCVDFRVQYLLRACGFCESSFHIQLSALAVVSWPATISVIVFIEQLLVRTSARPTWAITRCH